MSPGAYNLIVMPHYGWGKLMNIKNVGAVLALGVSLAGCAQVVWDKPGATQQDFAKDSYECERDMRQGGYYGGGIIGAINAQEFEGRCMNARGWVARQTR